MISLILDSEVIGADLTHELTRVLLEVSHWLRWLGLLHHRLGWCIPSHAEHHLVVHLLFVIHHFEDLREHLGLQVFFWLGLYA